MEIVTRALKLTAFDRRTATALMLDSTAMGDAVLLVAAVRTLVVAVNFLRFRVFSLTGFLESILTAVVAWLVLSMAIWFMGSRLLKGTGEADAMMRTAGFASLPLVLSAVSLGWVGLVWHLAILVLVTGVVLGLGIKESVAAVALGAALVYLISLLFRAPLLGF